MNLSRVSERIFVLISFALLTACSSPESSESGRQPDATRSSERGNAVGSNSDRLTVEFNPPAPTSRDDITAMIKGRVEGPAFSWTKNGAFLHDFDGPRLPSSNFVSGDVVAVTVTGGGREVKAEAIVANSPPKITAVLFEDPYIYRGVDIRVLPQAEDPDGDFIDFYFRWELNGEDISLNGNLLPGDKFRKGDRISLQVTPFDGFDYGPVFEGKDIVIPNAPPSFLTNPPTEFTGWTYLYDTKAEDPDGDEMTYSLIQSPPGMTIDSKTGQVVWVVGRNGSGAHPIAIAAQDEEGMKTIQEYVLHVGFSQ